MNRQTASQTQDDPISIARIFGFGRNFLTLIFLLTIIFSILLTFIAARWGYYEFSIETGPLELFQLVAILVTGAAFMVTAWSLSGTARLLCAWAVVLSIAMLQREIDFSILGVDHWLHSLRSNSFRVPFWTIIVVPMALWSLRVKPGLAGLRPFLQRSIVWVPVLIAGLLLLSQPIEDALHAAETEWMHDRLLFAEELAETQGYLILLLAALAIARRIINMKPAAYGGVNSKS